MNPLQFPSPYTLHQTNFTFSNWVLQISWTDDVTDHKKDFINITLGLLWTVVSCYSQRLLHALDVNKYNWSVRSWRPAVQQWRLWLKTSANRQATVIELLRWKWHDSVMLSQTQTHTQIQTDRQFTAQTLHQAAHPYSRGSNCCPIAADIGAATHTKCCPNSDDVHQGRI